MQYYFVGTALPALYLDVKPEITFTQFDILLKDNLTRSDYRKFQHVRRLYDLLNLRAYWKEEPLDPYGEMDAVQLEEALAGRIGLPDFVYEFVDSHEKNEDKVRYFPLLLAKYFQLASQDADPFIRWLMTLERDMRLIFTGFRAKKLGWDLSAELQYEDPEEELIASMLAQKDEKTFEPPEKYHELKLIYEAYNNDPLKLQRAIDEYRYNAVENWVDMADAFSIERILAYLVQFMIVRKWSEMDKEQGIKVVDSIVKEA